GDTKLRILITGAKGTVGRHVTKKLTEQGHEVTGLERFDLVDNDEYVKCDIVYPEEVNRAYADVKPDLTIHMAAEVGRLNCELFPERVLRANVMGTLNIAKACIENGSKLINFSTSEVYGEAFDYSEVQEDFMLNALGQTNIYAISKVTGEAIAKHYSHNYGLKALTVRPIMLYGEGERPNKYRSALTNFVGQALKNQPLTVHKGTLRAWCHYDDFTDGLSLLLDGDMIAYEAFNIGTEEYCPTEDLARMVCQVVGAPESLINLVDPPEHFLSPIKRVSLEKIKALGYSPKITLKEGIKRVVKWQRDKLLG
ncbi:MAG: NAD(P)-dependent oxidoreductase, partial [Candidatus Micrarchaeota archaeon]|nr:NAD(P)-dependent oxidoreductase [Candidatus Micrarchaeota archaeon]